jgi:hypothetical protein
MEGKRIVREINKPRWIPRLGLTFLQPVVTFGVAFLVGFFVSAIAGTLLFFGVLVLLRWINTLDPQFLSLWFLPLGKHYDPALWEDMHESFRDV